MINQKSIAAISESHFGPFCKPLYGSYSFTRIPDTIQKLLLGHSKWPLPTDTIPDKTYDTVVLILIDCFGWRFFEKYADKFPFLTRFIDRGIVSKLTSQFPSTTANHITCIHTGLTVGQSGVYEWFYYDPIVDDVICPLRFSYANDDDSNSLLAKGFTPEELFPMQPIYPRLQNEGVRTCIFQPKEIVHSPYSAVMQQGATASGFKHLSEGLSNLKESILEAKEKNYFFLYYPEIDSLSHSHGPDSPKVEKLITKTFDQLEKFFRLTSGKKENTALIVTADHGMAAMDPAKCHFLNLLLPDLESKLKKTGRGTPIGYCGSSRDLFLHIQEPYLLGVQSEVKRQLSGIAEIYLTQELIEAGLFGPLPLSKQFLERVGNLVILPYAPHSVWRSDVESSPYKGHHGGLSRQELETIFLFQEL
ncbi:MAG: alkaline phosphatase family protein [Verrucomicrobia bacterium]|nr:alkaline phosphatase family protein [Verrucomicrobiota bacterium]